MVAYRPNLSAQAVDRHLRDALEDLRKAEKHTVLWFAEVMNRKLYRELGHSSILVTADVYSHLFDESRDELAARLDRNHIATNDG